MFCCHTLALVREACLYENGGIFGKIPKGWSFPIQKKLLQFFALDWGRVISNPKIFVAHHFWGRWLSVRDKPTLRVSDSQPWWPPAAKHVLLCSTGSPPPDQLSTSTSAKCCKIVSMFTAGKSNGVLCTFTSEAVATARSLLI